MAIERRYFLKIAGLSALFGVAGRGAYELVLPGQVDAAEMEKPLEALTGKRWGMAVDLSLFHQEADTTPLVDACNQAHNVPQIPNAKNIKWIWPTTYEHAFTHKAPGNMVNESLAEKPIMVMCNHCDNPPCVRVCPTKATFRRDDGIVMMDMHRCIGCRFCMAACPYGSRSFNFYDPRLFLPKKLPTPDYPTRSKGVVEKCTFCADRLAKGQLPACVEAGKGKLVFGDLADPRSDLRLLLRERYSIRRKPFLGTRPSVYYLV